MNLIALLPLLLSSLPGIIAGVEAAADPSTTGAEKKAAVLSACTAAAAAAKQIDPNDVALIDTVTKLVGPTVDMIVSVYNFIGKFVHKPKAASAQP